MMARYGMVAAVKEFWPEFICRADQVIFVSVVVP
jgi:hypothetical protein